MMYISVGKGYGDSQLSQPTLNIHLPELAFAS